MLEKAEAKGEELTAKVNEQQRLIQKLEDDILKVCKEYLISSSCVCLLFSDLLSWFFFAVVFYIMFLRL